MQSSLIGLALLLHSALAFSPANVFTRYRTNIFRMSMKPEETAVVLIEYQNEFTTEGGKLHDAVKPVMDATGMIQNSKTFMDAARAKGCKIVHCPIQFDSGHPEISKNPYGILAGVKDGQAFSNDEWGSKICDEMKPTEGDIIVKGKSGLCGFKSTNLDFLLVSVRRIFMLFSVVPLYVHFSLNSFYRNFYRGRMKLRMLCLADF